MEKMPYQEHVEQTRAASPAVVMSQQVEAWRIAVPGLKGAVTSVRELRVSDAPALFIALSSEEVARFISPPPTTIEGFEGFIRWAQRERAAGRYVCFAVTPRGSDVAIGLFQLRALEADFGTAEWGFAVAVEYWGSGVFHDAARSVMGFAFDVMHVHRLEARAALKNGRGNGALRKLGARQEGILRRSFLRHGEYHDQALWTLLADDWLRMKAVWGPRVVH